VSSGVSASGFAGGARFQGMANWPGVPLSRAAAGSCETEPGQGPGFGPAPCGAAGVLDADAREPIIQGGGEGEVGVRGWGVRLRGAPRPVLRPGRAAGCIHPFVCPRRVSRGNGRVRVRAGRGCGQVADAAVAQAAEDQGDQLAGGGDLGDVLGLLAAARTSTAPSDGSRSPAGVTFSDMTRSLPGQTSVPAVRPASFAGPGGAEASTLPPRRCGRRRCGWRAGPARRGPGHYRMVIRGSAREAASCTLRSSTPAPRLRL